MIISREFGKTSAGETVWEYTLTNASGNSVSILNFGCTIRSIKVFGVDVCLGYDSMAEYERNDGYLGAVAGRCANRIGEGRFCLNNKVYQLDCNDDDNHLHGGLCGFSHRVWEAEIQADTLSLHRFSPDGEEKYPGGLDVTVTYRLSEDNGLSIAYHALAHEDTILNLTNHAYFNLNGSGTVLGHLLKINADEITECDAHCLTTGRLLAVDDTPFDFRQEKPIGRDIEDTHYQIRNGCGYDNNFVLRPGNTAAQLTGDVTGISMTVCTDQPGIQIYSANFLTERPGKNGARYDRRCALCLETQNFPNAIAYPHFPSPILRAGQCFDSVTIYRFYNH